METQVHTSSDSSEQTTEIHTFRDNNGNVPFWDDPSVHGGIDRPKKYQPRTDMMSVVSDFYHNRFNKDDDFILCLLRDAIAINENQLRRLLRGKLASNRISDRLRFMSVFGVTDKWLLRSREDNATLPPSPWSVGIGGFLYLKHMYRDFTMHPSKLIAQGVKGIQRYVALNEIRTQLYEYAALRGWKWHGVIAKNPKLGKPLAVGTMKGPQGDIHLVIERLQQSQSYMEHIIKRIINWNQVFQQKNHLPIMDLPNKPSVLILSVATDSMAHHIASQIPTEGISLPIWFVTDERLERDGLPKSFLGFTAQNLYPIPLNYLEKVQL